LDDSPHILVEFSKVKGFFDAFHIPQNLAKNNDGSRSKTQENNRLSAWRSYL